MTDAAQLRARLAASRAQQGLGTEAAEVAGLLPAGSMLTPPELAAQQVSEAVARGRLDLTGSPRWPWAAVDDLVGQMLPGELWVVGALTGNGKSAFLMSAMDAWAERQTSTLYIPLEIDPQEMRRRWAAWRLGLDIPKVMRNQWGDLDEGAQEAHEMELEAQAANPYIHFAPPTHITMAGITKWTRWAHSHLGVRQVILDHFQRVDHNEGAPQHRLAAHQTARQLRDLGRELGLAIISAAQINRSLDPLDAFRPPILARLKDTAGLAEEASVVLMLSRKLRDGLTRDDHADFAAGRKEEPEMGESGTMLITCRKHRLDDIANNRRRPLTVKNGRVCDYAPVYTGIPWREP